MARRLRGGGRKLVPLRPGTNRRKATQGTLLAGLDFVLACIGICGWACFLLASFASAAAALPLALLALCVERLVHGSKRCAPTAAR